jgi:hypothetical protein
MEIKRVTGKLPKICFLSKKSAPHKKGTASRETVPFLWGEVDLAPALHYLRLPEGRTLRLFNLNPLA